MSRPPSIASHSHAAAGLAKRLTPTAFHLFRKLGVAILLSGFVAHGFATELGEDAGGKSPSECVMHLKRLQPVSEEPWKQQLFQNGIDLKPGADYVLTFWGRASDSFKLGVSTKISAPPWSFFGLRDDLLLTPEWKRYTFHFNATGAQPGQTRLTFNFVTPDAGDVWLTDIDLRPAKASADPSENVVVNAKFSEGLSPWFIDGRQPGMFEGGIQPLSEANATEKK